MSDIKPTDTDVINAIYEQIRGLGYSPNSVRIFYKRLPRKLKKRIKKHGKENPRRKA
jgi:hypothetical protein